MSLSRFRARLPSVKMPQPSPQHSKLYRSSGHHGDAGGGDARWRGRYAPPSPTTSRTRAQYLWQKAARDPDSATFLKSPLPHMKYSYRNWLLDHSVYNVHLLKTSIKKKMDENTEVISENQYDSTPYSASVRQAQVKEVAPSAAEKMKRSRKRSCSSRRKVKESRRSSDKISTATHNLQYAPSPARGCLKSPNTSKVQKAPRVRFQLEKTRTSDSPRVYRISQTDTNLSSINQIHGKKEIRRRADGKPVRVHPKTARSIRSSSYGPGMLSNIPRNTPLRSVRKTTRDRPREGSIPAQKISSKGSYLSKGSIGTERTKSTSPAKRKKGKRKRKSESGTESEVDFPPVYFTPSPSRSDATKPSDSSQNDAGPQKKKKRRIKEDDTMAEEKNRIHPNKASEHSLSEASERKVEKERQSYSHHEMLKEGDKNSPKQSKKVLEIEKSTSRHSKNILNFRHMSVRDATKPFPHELRRQKCNKKKKVETSSKSNTESSGKSKKCGNKDRKIEGKRELLQKHQENRGTIYNLNRMFYEEDHYDRRALHPLFDVATNQYRPPNHTALRAEERKFSKKVNIIHQLQKQRQMKKEVTPRSGFLLSEVASTATRIPWK